MLFSKKEQKFRNAYSDYYPLIFKKLYSRLGSREDAEDICHEVFVSMYVKLEEIQDFRKWLLGAMRFAISNFYRRKGASNKGKIDIEELENDLNFSFENGFRDIRIIINEAIGDMNNFKDEKEKILFDLVAINNFSHEQAGKQLGLTKRQVQYKYGQIAQRILQYLHNKGIKNIDDLL